MIKNDVYYELFASVTVPNPDQVGYWVDLGANSKGKVIKIYNKDKDQWIKLTDATSDDAVAPYIGSNGNWFVDNRDTGVPAAGKNPYIGDNFNWYVFNPLTNKWEDTGIFAKGLSAYEIAVKHGFKGTEEEWLASLSKASEDAAVIALEAAKRADEATDRANTAAERTEQAVEDANAAADRNNEIANNPPKIVNEEWYVYDEITKTYKPTGVKAIGDAFSIVKEYPSIIAMEEDWDNPEVLVGQFVIINTGDVEEPDDAKLYLKSIEGWKFIVDMSGARGIRGYSAYEIAVHQGFVGTEADWIKSLKQPALDAAEEALAARDQVLKTEAEVKAAEAKRVTAENARVDAENKRVTAENERDDNEDIRISNENARKDAESKRVTAENSRVDAENIRVTNENNRKSAETARDNAEKARVQAEATRVSAENNRANQEAARVASESARVTNENNRKDAETARVNQENTRQSNETTRQTNENTRKVNETARIEAENLRVAAEEKREQDTATAISNAEEATANANTQANRAKAYADNPPKIVERQWWVYDETTKAYKNTGVYAIGEAGKSPIVRDNHWWVYDNTLGDYVDTGAFVSSFVINVTYVNSNPTLENTDFVSIKSALEDNVPIVIHAKNENAGINRWYIPSVTNTASSNKFTFYIDEGTFETVWTVNSDDSVTLTSNRFVIDDLTQSSETNRPLSARQGYKLDQAKIEKTKLPSAITDIDDAVLTDFAASVSYTRTNSSSGQNTTESFSISSATQSAAGLMSKADKVKLDGIETGAQVNVKSDWNATSGDAQILNKPTLDTFGGIPKSEKGVANGVATLDTEGKVPSSQLPSYVDDVLEYPNRAGFPATGESGKVYIAADTNVTYRWSGSSYVIIGSDLALGETSSTAYPGDKGKKNAEDIAAINTKFNNYSTTAQNDAKYLKLTGGTLSGRLTQGIDTDNVIHFRRVDAESQGYIGYMNSISGREGMWVRATNPSDNAHILVVHDNGNLTFDTNKVWHAGNDGSGSGLDADTVDGRHTSNLILYSSDINANSAPTNEAGYGYSGKGWKVGGGPALSIGSVLENKRYVLQIQGNNQGKIYTRAINADVGSDWKEFAFLDSNGKVTNAVNADLASKATQLNTARTIWGQSFNGTANIDGSLVGVTSITASGSISTAHQIRTTGNSTTEGGFFNINNPGSSWNAGNGAYNVAISNNDKQTPLLLAYKLGGADYAGANRLFALELSNQGDIAKFSFGGAPRFNFNSNGTLTATTFVGALQGNATTATTATTANKVANTLTFAAGKFAAKTFNGSAATTVNIPTNTSHLINDSGFLTTVAWSSVTDKPTWIGSSKPTYTAVEVGALASNGTAVAATKLATARTIWGNNFDGTGNITGIFTSTNNIATSAQIVTNGNDDAYSGFFVSNHNGGAWCEKVGAYNLSLKDSGEQTPLLLVYRKDTDFNVRANRIFEMDVLNNGTSVRFYMKGTEDSKFEFLDNGKFLCKYLAGELDYSYVKNVIKNSNEFNVVDEGYTDGANTTLWFNYRRISGSGKIPNISFGTASGSQELANLYCGGINSSSRVVIPGEWFENQTPGVGLYNSGTGGQFYAANGPQWHANHAVTTDSNMQAVGGFFKQSDARLKTDIAPLTHTLEDILAIPTSRFTMDGKKQIGTIAQEIEEKFPEVVIEFDKKLSEVPERDDWEVEIKEEADKEVKYVKVKQVEYEMLAILALEGLKLLNQKVDNLKEELLNR